MYNNVVRFMGIVIIMITSFFNFLLSIFHITKIVIRHMCCEEIDNSLQY